MSFQIGRSKNTTWRDRQIRSLATQLIVHEKLIIPAARAKQLQSKFDHLVTLAKQNTLHSRRQAAAYLRQVQISDNQNVLQKLFDEIGKKYKKRNGGYTRIIKYGNRKGDNAPITLITLV